MQLGDHVLEWGTRTFVMGIINTTPDSFSGDGLAGSVEAAVAQAERMIREGADILDVGGESTRPGAEPVPEDEELRRTAPVVAAMSRLGVPVSIDTRRAAVADAALSAGASLINDVTALSEEPDMVSVALRHEAGICLMHMRGEPRTMQDAPEYDDVVRGVADYLRQRAEVLADAGIPYQRMLVDPGIGFGKTLDHNLDLMNNLDVIRERCKLPVLVGPSRKSFIGRVLDLPVEQRIFGTAAAVAVAVARGADVVRVHDVAEIAQTARLADAIVRR
jgi:dihydropteroate synthase